jgi:hypothetical protein
MPNLQVYCLKCAPVELLAFALIVFAAGQIAGFAQPVPRYAVSAVDLEIAPDELDAFIAGKAAA